MAAGFKKIERRHRGQTILIVSHGDPLWMLESWLLELSPKAALEFGKKAYLKTGEVHKLSISNGRLRFKKVYQPAIGQGP